MKYSFASVFSSSLLISHLPSLILRHFRQRVALCASLPLLLVIGTTSASVAQTYGNGPAVSNFNPTTFNTSFGLATGVNCPAPSFSIVGFTGSASDYARSRSSTAIGSSNSGLDNYGIAAGFTFPLGGRYTEFCRDFAETQTLNSRTQLAINKSRFKAEVVRQCYFLFSIHIDFNNEYYNEDGPGAALFPCREIVRTINPPQAQEEGRSATPKDLKEQDLKRLETTPSFSQPDPLTPTAIPSIPTQ